MSSECRIPNRVTVSVGVVASSFNGLLAVEAADPPEVPGGYDEAGDNSTKESTKSGEGNVMVLADVLAVVSLSGSSALLIHVFVEVGCVDDHNYERCGKSGN